MIAEYKPDTKCIVINTDTQLEEDTLAATILHEGVHAMDDQNGTLESSVNWFDPSPLIRQEQKAIRADTQFWSMLYPYGKLPTRNATDVQMNDRLTWLRDGTLDAAVATSYRELFYAGKLTKESVMAA